VLGSGETGSVLGDILSVIFSFEIDTPIFFPYILSQKKIVSHTCVIMVDGEGYSVCHKKGGK
jgi:hypothetical protein